MTTPGRALEFKLQLAPDTLKRELQLQRTDSPVRAPANVLQFRGWLPKLDSRLIVV